MSLIRHKGAEVAVVPPTMPDFFAEDGLETFERPIKAAAAPAPITRRSLRDPIGDFVGTSESFGADVGVTGYLRSPIDSACATQPLM